VGQESRVTTTDLIGHHYRYEELQWPLLVMEHFLSSNSSEERFEALTSCKCKELTTNKPKAH